MVTQEQLRKLPEHYRIQVEKEHLDAMGHMNVRWYMAFFDSAAWSLFADMGMHEPYYHEYNCGIFALKHHITYLAEVQTGETVCVRSRILRRSEKRVLFMLFLVNESRGMLAATLESLASHIDLSVRKSSPFPGDIAAELDRRIREQEGLSWVPPGKRNTERLNF